MMSAAASRPRRWVNPQRRASDFRIVTSSIVTAELDMRRIRVRTEDDIVVDFETG